MVVSSVSPATATAGSAPLTVTVTGSGFSNTTAVQVNGVTDPTTYVSATQLTVAIPASQLASGGNLAVVAVDGSSTSAAGTAVDLTVTNPSPTVGQLIPTTLTVGSTLTAVNVVGTNFVPATVIQVNGNTRPSAYVSATQETVVLDAADVIAAGTLSVTAMNPSPGGGTSTAASLNVSNPVPTASSLTPAIVIRGTTSPVTITLTGTNFTPGSVVQVGGSSRATTYVSSTQVSFQATVADMASTGMFAIKVVNPAPGGGATATLSLYVSAPTATPVISSLSPTSLVVNGGNQTLAVYGTGINGATTVQWNGTNLTTALYGGTYIVANVPASLLTSTGTAQITLTTSTASPSTSAAQSISINNPPAPTLTAISPNYGPMNTGAKVTLTGTGFLPTSTVSFNGTNLPATYVGPTSISVTLPASATSLPGNGSFTVTTPAPGGGTTGAVVYSVYIPIANNSMVYDPANGLFYVSVPGSAGAPLGNSVVSVDPATGALGKPIFVGSEPNKLAITADGHYLWVALDGGSAIRQVDLQTNTAGLQFSLPNKNSGIYNSPSTVMALAALPGSPNSVIVQQTGTFINGSGPLVIYDSGVVRGTPPTESITINALAVDGSRSEIYAAGSGLQTLNYSSTGLTKLATNANITLASTSQDEIQLLSGKLYTDTGKIYDAESGGLLGTLYQTGTTVAQGSTVVDPATSKIFVLESTGYAYNGYNQIQVFNMSDFTSTGVTIPLNGSSNPYSYYSQGARLTRWGANGLATRTPLGIWTVQSNSVVDLSSQSADVAVAMTTGGSSSTGGTSTFTATVTNKGTATATDVALSAQAPATGTVTSVTSSTGSCSSTNGILCSFGSIPNGGAATVVISVLQYNAGTSTVTAQVSASSPDPVSTNNLASSSVTVTGSSYNAAPVLTSISPAAIASGSSDTTITINGTGFSSASTVMLGSTSLSTSFVSSTQLTATVPAAQLSSMGWQPVTISNPSPGGGTSNPEPLTVYTVLTIGLNHILYDPFSRNLMGSVGSGSASITGNSIVAIDPATGEVGSPVSIGSQPGKMALTSDGNILYTLLSGSNSVARYNMTTGQADFTVPLPTNTSMNLRDIAAEPGTENTVAIDEGSWPGNGLYDFNPTAKTATLRGALSGPYTGSCLQFLDASNMYSFDIDTSGASLIHYPITSSGFTYYNYSNESTLDNFGCFKIDGGLAYANAGGIANPATYPATQIAILSGPSGGTFSVSQALAPDSSLRRAFYPVANSSSGVLDGIAAYDLNTYLSDTTVSLNQQATEGANTAYTDVDIIRWGQDGLALLSSGNHLYLLRGAFVVPQLLNQNTAATLTSVSSSTIQHGSGNTVLTLTGSNFVPGVAVTWNGSYRTTTIVSPTQITVAIPASDLAAAGSASLVAVNPGASASASLTVTIQ